MGDDLIANLPVVKPNEQDRAALSGLLNVAPEKKDNSLRRAVLVALLVMLLNNAEITEMLEKNIHFIQGSPLGMLMVKGGLAGVIFFLISFFMN